MTAAQTMNWREHGLQMEQLVNAILTVAEDMD